MSVDNPRRDNKADSVQLEDELENIYSGHIPFIEYRDEDNGLAFIPEVGNRSVLTSPPSQPAVSETVHVPTPASAVRSARRLPRSFLIVGVLCVTTLILGSFLTISLRTWLLPHTAITSQVASFSQAPCPFKPTTGIKEGKDVSCGYLTVPEDRQHANGHTIKLAVAVFKAPDKNPASEPLLYLSGGPGGSLLGDVGPIISHSDEDGISLESISLGHDLILMDQRGTGFSQPSLTCQEVGSYNKATQNKNLSRDEQSAEFVQAMHNCQERLAATGVNFNAYTTLNNAADVHDLIHALGYKQVNLYGVSYGTRLALTIMRLFPDDLRSVILDSVVPAQINLFTNMPIVTQHAYDTLFKGCVSNEICQQEYPRLQNTFYDLVSKLNAHPITFKDGKYGTVLLNGDSLAGWVFSAMYITSFIPYLPMAIDQIAHGDYSILASTYGMLMLTADLSYGMYFSVQCGEEMAFTSKEALIQTGSVLRAEVRSGVLSNLQSDYAVCQFWGMQPVPDLQKQPVTSSLPTLILSGEFDPITPTANAKLVQQTLSNSQLFVFPAIGHGAFLADPCPGTIMADFIQNPQQRPDSSCIEAMQEPDFQ
jgi:pimeloyl-ACP methyl ester carboxylesterase